MFETPIEKIIEGLGTGWARVLRSQADETTFLTMMATLAEIYVERPVYPDEEDIFNAFKLTPLEEVSIVILGQDPYHTHGTAHGLAFSSLSGKIPPSLQNVFKELKTDVGAAPDSADLTAWAKQGVLLLNTILTVEQGSPGSHRGLGWEEFTSFVLKGLLSRTKPTVFMLWGKNAKEALNLVPAAKRRQHLVLTASHPSPYSAEGFFGCRHFSQANDFLRENGLKPIEWVPVGK